MNWRKMNGVAFTLGIVIYGLFGFLFAAGGWYAVRGGEWSSQRITALGMFGLGVLLLVQVTVGVVSFLRANDETK
jgi:hypothetical protein